MGKEAPYSPGFCQAAEETVPDTLPFRGKLPLWLNGELIRIAPAFPDLKKSRLKHWFDGYGYLYKFEIHDNEIRFSSRFLKSAAFKDALDAQRPKRPEYATRPSRSILEALVGLFRSPKPSDNANANIISLPGGLAAVSDYSFPLRFSPDNLTTLAPVAYEDELSGDRMISHPQYDEEGNLYGLLIRYGRPAKYILYRQAPDSPYREEVGQIEADPGCYMHSIGMSENYFILVECPLVAPPSAPFRSGKAFIESFRWEPDRGTRFRIVDRHSGRELATPTGEAFFSFHHVNAFEEGKSLMIDMVVYPDASVINSFYLSSLRAQGDSVVTAHLMRIVIDMESGTVEDEIMMSETCFELPRINPAYSRRSYRYCYGAGDLIPGEFFDSIVKLDLKQGETKVWRKRNCYPGEPVFVANPQGRREDDGVLLCVVLNAHTQTSFLCILDAVNLEEIARAYAPICIPFGMHGYFYPAGDA